MSTNNELILIKEGKNFEVHENLCVDNNFEPDKSTLLKSFPALEEAIKYANEYCAEYPYVEYGYHIDGSCLEGAKRKK